MVGKIKGRKKRRWMSNGWMRKGTMEGRKEDRRWIVE